MKPRRISTDREGARALGRLMRPGASPQRLRPAGIPQKSGVVVEIISEIPAGSTDAVTADVMQLQGGSWETTGATVEVRSLTGQAVSTTGRRIARRIGRHGWGVVET